MKYFFLALTLVVSNLTFAATKCDYGGVQKVLRDSANTLHAGQHVRYIDLNPDFQSVFDRLQPFGVTPARIQQTWEKSIKVLCGAKASKITIDSFSADKTLEELTTKLGAY